MKRPQEEGNPYTPNRLKSKLPGPTGKKRVHTRAVTRRIRHETNTAAARALQPTKEKTTTRGQPKTTGKIRSNLGVAIPETGMREDATQGQSGAKQRQGNWNLARSEGSKTMRSKKKPRPRPGYQIRSRGTALSQNQNVVPQESLGGPNSWNPPWEGTTERKTMDNIIEGTTPKSSKPLP